MGVNPDFKFIATEQFSMSLLDQKPTMKNFSEAIEGLSLSTREGISIAISKFNDFTKRECDGKSIDETIKAIKDIPKEQQEAKLFQVLQAWINDMAKKGKCVNPNLE